MQIHSLNIHKKLCQKLSKLKITQISISKLLITFIKLKKFQKFFYHIIYYTKTHLSSKNHIFRSTSYLVINIKTLSFDTIDFIPHCLDNFSKRLRFVRQGDDR